MIAAIKIGGVDAGQAVPLFLSEMAPASYRGKQQDHTYILWAQLACDNPNADSAPFLL